MEGNYILPQLLDDNSEVILVGMWLISAVIVDKKEVIAMEQGK